MGSNVCLSQAGAYTSRVPIPRGIFVPKRKEENQTGDLHTFTTKGVKIWRNVMQ